MTAPVFLDRVMETSLTSGTGAYVLVGPVKGYQSFSSVGDGNPCYYAASDNLASWEVGLGTYAAANRSLSRDTVLASSNNGNPVAWLPTPKFVWLDFPASLASILGNGTTGTGAVVLADGATLVEPDLGTPSAIDLMNASGLASISSGAGVLPSANGGVSAPSVATYGATDGGSGANLLTAFQDSINELPSGGPTSPVNGGRIVVPKGNYSNLDPSLLTVGTKVVSWMADGGAVLPTGMPGVIWTEGVAHLNDWSGGSPRSIQAYDWANAGNLPQTASYRTYVHLVTFHQPDFTPEPTELENVAYYADITTDTNAIVDSIRAFKGAAHALSGKSNLRSIYGFAESSEGGGHTGYLTGVLGTVYKNDNSNADGDSYGLRSNIDAGSSGGVQVAGAKVGENNTFQYGYTMRGGTGGPALASLAAYMAHGGGTGDMFQGQASNTDGTVIYKVTNKAHQLDASSYSGNATIADDAFLTIPAPNTAGGMWMVWGEAFDGCFALAFFRASGTALLRNAGTLGSLTTLTAGTTPTGTTGPDGDVNLYCNGANLYIENRAGAARSISWKFFAR